MKLPPRPILLVFLFTFAVAELAAQVAPVVVNRVRFDDDVRPYDWTRIAIELEANAIEDPQAVNPEYIDNIEIELSSAYDRGDDTFAFFTAKAEIMTLKVGEPKTVMFWIPKAIMERGNLRAEPKFWVVELAAGGRSLQVKKDNASRELQKTGATGLANFKRMLSENIGPNSGVMLPHNLTPYYAASGSEMPPYKFIDPAQ